VQLLTAPVAILADALSYLASALLIARLRAPEQPPPRDETGRGLWSEARAGLRTVLRDPVLSAMATSLCLFNLFYHAIGAVYVLFVTRELGIPPAGVGLVYVAGSAAFPVGAAAAGGVARRLGVGGAIVWGAAVSDAGFLLLPLAGGPPAVAVAVLVASRLVATLGGPVTAINQLSLRQAVTPDRLLGRVNGAMLTIALGTAPLGALLGGLLGDALGLRPAVLIGAIGLQLGFVRLLRSPVRSLRHAPGRAGAGAGGANPS
jgi:predicted MFS family arabinose efflux permease